LRRTEVGEDRLQGVDYTYTINGWLKAINSPNLLATEDPWTDGYAQSEVAADEFSEVIGYHENDFTRTGPLLANAGNKYYLPTTRNLYNGNISTLTSKIGSSTDGSYPNTLTGNAYTYDRLNRITGSDFKVFNTTAGNFGSTDNFHEDFKYDGNGNITKVTRNGFSTAVPNNSNAQMDKLVYDYYPNTNKLKRINETTTSPLNSKLQDLTQQVDENYVYDEAGYLKFDKAENLEFKWTYNGKISEMIPISSTGKYKPHVKYAYDAQGNRVKKEVNEAPFSATGVRQTLPGKIKTTSYARDAQGNIMAVYEIEKTPSSIGEVHTYKLKELPIYGSDRIGIYKPEALIDYFTYSATQKQVFANRPFGSSNERTVGKKEYELKDHLGNVRVVFSDLRSESSPGGKETDVRSYYNYYAFGAIQPGRNSSTRDYRFNFNGKEMDYEIGWQDYGMRIYRPDIGRFGSVDPITSQYPELTPYQFASNRPIDAIDIDGLESGPVNGVNSQAYGEAFRNFGKGINTWGSNPGDPGLAHSLENATGLPRGSLKTNYDVLRGYMTMLGQRGAGGNPWKSGGPWGAQRNLITKPKIGATTIKVSNLRINVGGEGEMTGLIDVNPLVGNLRDEAAIRQRNPTGDFIKAGAEKLPFPDESVIDYSSIGLNKNAFEFPEQVASEAIRVLAPGGKAIINSNSFIFMNARVRKSFEDRGFKITPNGQSAIITKPHKTN
jgi:RHS repeat-associated protein